MKEGKNKQYGTKIARGYRLKPSTHKLVKRVQHILNASQDAVISGAMSLFSKKIRANKKTINNNKKN